VKTLHPTVHGGILARRTTEGLAELQAHNIAPIDIVICNLYPFNETLKKPGVTELDIIENIDIGGVTLLRAAAKNHEYVITICDPNDYSSILQNLKAGILQEQRKKLALKAFQHTAQYYSSIAAWFEKSLQQ